MKTYLLALSRGQGYRGKTVILCHADLGQVLQLLDELRRLEPRQPVLNPHEQSLARN
jgi:hypothetical protein